MYDSDGIRADLGTRQYETVKVEAPTITPGSCKYNGTIMPVITADEGCSIVYVKSTSKLYTTVEDIDKN